MTDLLKCLSQIGRLKALARAGWVREGITQPESVADHSFRTAVMALVLGPALSVNVDKLIKMLLVHDLAESDPTVGDITPLDGIPAEQKHRRESAAMVRLCSGFPEGDELLALWQEFEDGKTPESQLARQLDLFEMALQAAEYERTTGLSLKAFREQALNRLREPILVELYRQLQRSLSDANIDPR